jgi:hypothetical protein
MTELTLLHRNMCFSVPSVIPLTNRLRLFESDPSVVSLDAVLEHMCFLKNMDADDALTVYRNQVDLLSPISVLVQFLNHVCNEVGWRR